MSKVTVKADSLIRLIDLECLIRLTQKHRGREREGKRGGKNIWKENDAYTVTI